MKGSDLNLECTHGTHQLNDVMGLIPAGIQQSEPSLPPLRPGCGPSGVDVRSPAHYSLSLTEMVTPWCATISVPLLSGTPVSKKVTEGVSRKM